LTGQAEAHQARHYENKTQNLKIKKTQNMNKIKKDTKKNNTKMPRTRNRLKHIYHSQNHCRCPIWNYIKQLSMRTCWVVVYIR